MVKLVCCGAINWDINLFVRRIPCLSEEVEVSNITRVPGGTGANVAVAASRVLGTGNVAFIGTLGDDKIGKKQLEILTKEGVDTSLINILKDVESGQAYILIDEQGGNVINTYLGANKFLEPVEVRHIRNTKAMIVTDPPLNTAKKLLSDAHSFGITTIWDPGFYSELGLELLYPLMEYTDYFILNEGELQTLVKTSSMRKVKELIPSNLIVKQGSKGSTLITKNISISLPAIPLDTLGLRVVNTTGCGDVFVGVFAVCKVLGYNDIDAIKKANLAAGIKASRYETRGGPNKQELEEFYRKVDITNYNK
jgi:ribokinase